MALKFEFDKTSSPLLGTIHRPVAKVLFNVPQKDRWREIWMLVDTGADYTILPRYLAERFGVDLENDCQIHQTSGIGGAEKVFFLSKMKVRLGKWERKIPVGFLDRDEIPPLMGRHLLLETFETHFSKDYTVTFDE